MRSHRRSFHTSAVIILAVLAPVSDLPGFIAAEAAGTPPPSAPLELDAPQTLTDPLAEPAPVVETPASTNPPGTLSRPAAKVETSLPSALAKPADPAPPIQAEAAPLPPDSATTLAPLPDTVTPTTDTQAITTSEPPPPPANSTDTTVEASNQSQGRPQRPLTPYEAAHPPWAIQFSVGTNAYGEVIEGVQASEIGSKHFAQSFSMQFEYQPPFLQRFGMVTLGPSLDWYFTGISVPFQVKNTFAVYSYGGQIRYQARYFNNQWLVPVVGYQAQYWNYSTADGAEGRMLAKGPTFGLMFLLNAVEPDVAKDFFVTEGVARSYLLAEFRNINGNDGNINLTGKSLFIGLRLEF